MTSQDEQPLSAGTWKERTLTLQAKVPGGFSLSCPNDRPLDFSRTLFADPNRAGFQWLHAERYSWQDGFHIGQASTRPSFGGSMAWLCCRNSLTRILEAVDDIFHLKGALKVGTGRWFDFEEIQGGASCERRTARWFSRRF